MTHAALAVWRDWRGHAWLGLAARLYLGAVFLAACWHKILDPGSFAVDIATYGMLPTELVNPLAHVLPWVEALAGLQLVIGWRTRAAALLVAAMMAMFVVAVTWAVTHDLQMSCGCFASQALAEDPISGWTILRDVAWLALAGYVVACDRRPLGLDRLPARARR